MPINKVVSSFDEAVADVHDGATILIGGFGTPGGCPSYLIRALAKRGSKNLTIVGNTTGLGRELIQQLARLCSQVRPTSKRHFIECSSDKVKALDS